MKQNWRYKIVETRDAELKAAVMQTLAYCSKDLGVNPDVEFVAELDYWEECPGCYEFPMSVAGFAHVNRGRNGTIFVDSTALPRHAVRTAAHECWHIRFGNNEDGAAAYGDRVFNLMADRICPLPGA